MSLHQVLGRAGAALAVLLAAPACGSKRVLVPPRLDLAPHARIALVTFTVENARGGLHTFATQRFAEHVLAAQPGIEILEVGPADSLLARVGEREFGPRAARALGEEQEVRSVFVGHLIVSDVKPRATLSGGLVPRAEASVQVRLAVRLLSTASGATLWRSSATATETVGAVGLSGGVPYFSAEDPNEAYGRLVNRLVYTVTYDLRPTWQKQ
ncbi:MAG TPA: hypothetical protein VNI61_03530 [Gemmatimonadales bacterium]|nr:hypothetical protein [Gemmatimonadales bacterium]